MIVQTGRYMFYIAYRWLHKLLIRKKKRTFFALFFFFFISIQLYIQKKSRRKFVNKLLCNVWRWKLCVGLNCGMHVQIAWSITHKRQLMICWRCRHFMWHISKYKNYTKWNMHTSQANCEFSACEYAQYMCVCVYSNRKTLFWYIFFHSFYVSRRDRSKKKNMIHLQVQATCFNICYSY